MRDSRGCRDFLFPESLTWCLSGYLIDPLLTAVGPWGAGKDASLPEGGGPLGSIREPSHALLIHKGLVLTGFRETPGSHSELKFKDNCSVGEHETPGKVRTFRMTDPLHVTLTQAARSKCNYGKVGQEETDESDADQR